MIAMDNEVGSSRSIPIGENGVIRIWYEEGVSTHQTGSKRWKVGVEIAVDLEDLDEAIDTLAVTIATIKTRVRSAKPHLGKTLEPKSSAEWVSKRPPHPKRR